MQVFSKHQWGVSQGNSCYPIPHIQARSGSATLQSNIKCYKGPHGKVRRGSTFDLRFLCLFGFSCPKALWTLGSSYAVVALPSTWSCLTRCCLSLSTDLNINKFSYETLQYKEKTTQKYRNTTPKTCRDLGRQMERHTWRYNEPQPYELWHVKDNWRENWEDALKILWKMTRVSEIVRVSWKAKKKKKREIYDNKRWKREAVCPLLLAPLRRARRPRCVSPARVMLGHSALSQADDHGCRSGQKLM